MLSFVIHLRLRHHKLYVNSVVNGHHPKSSILEHTLGHKVELNSGIIKGEIQDITSSVSHLVLGLLHGVPCTSKQPNSNRPLHCIYVLNMLV